MTCGYQVWWKGGLWLAATNHKVTCPFDYVITSGHLTSEVCYTLFPWGLLVLHLTQWWPVIKSCHMTNQRRSISNSTSFMESCGHFRQIHATGKKRYRTTLLRYVAITVDKGAAKKLVFTGWYDHQITKFNMTSSEIIFTSTRLRITKLERVEIQIKLNLKSRSTDIV